MDLSQKDESLVCGYDNGSIVLWGLTRTEHFKTITCPDKIPILSIKFWKETKNNLITSNTKGIVSLFKVEYSFFQWSVDKKLLLDLSESDKTEYRIDKSGSSGSLPDGVFSIQVLKKELLKSHPLGKYTIVALGSMKTVIIITLEPIISSVYRYNRPTGLPDLTIPSLSWGRGTLPGNNLTCFFVIYERIAYLYIILPEESALTIL